MTFRADQPNFQKLVRLIRDGKTRVIPFVGAGLSIYGAPEVRLPQWSELIHLLKKRAKELGLLQPEKEQSVERFMAEGKLIAAADVLVNALGEMQFRLIIEDALDLADRPMPPAVVELVCVSWSLMVTTNLDRMIEWAWSAKRSEPLVVLTNREPESAALAVSGTSLEPTLLKTHGTVERFDSWVLSQSHYAARINSSPTLVETLRLLYTQTLFFVGYGLSDDDFEPLLAQLKRLFPAGVSNLFALMDESKKGSPWAVRLIREFGVQPVWFRFDSSRAREEDCGYGEVVECLSLLVRAWASAAKGASFSLQYFPELEPTFTGRTHELEFLTTAILERHVPLVQVIGFGGEGKTTLVQRWLHEKRDRIIAAGFRHVIGCSLYKADVGRFVDLAYAVLFPEGTALGTIEKVRALREAARQQRLLLVLDGLEVVQQEDGNIGNPHLRDLMDAALRGRSTLLITSRTALPGQHECLTLDPLRTEDAVALLRRWQIRASESELLHAVRHSVGTHALSVRIIAGFLRSGGLANPSDLVGISPHRDVSDEADPRHANKASRVLRFYVQRLPPALLAVMKVLSVFPRAVRYAFLIRLLQEMHEPRAIAEALAGKDPRVLVDELQLRRLVQRDHETDLTCHPLVRDYFLMQVPEAERCTLHRELLRRYEAGGPLPPPSELKDCYPLFEACYHAAGCGDWSQFHSLFYGSLNRGLLKYLGYVLGAWDETLELALLTFSGRKLDGTPQCRPSYYHGIAASCLRRLGRNKGALIQYVRSITRALEDGPDAAYEIEAGMQLNCLLALCAGMGRLQLAAELVPLNFAAVQWISDSQERSWQLEHALISCGRIQARFGALEEAVGCFRAAQGVRHQPGYRSRVHHSLERVFYVDTLAALGKAHLDAAESEARENLQLAREEQFGDVVASALRALAVVHRNRARYAPADAERQLLLRAARRAISEARDIVRDRVNDELEVQIQLESLWVLSELYKAGLAPTGDEKAYCDRLDALLERSSLNLYVPVYLAAQARLDRLQGRRAEAKDRVLKALAQAYANGDELFAQHPRLELAPLVEECGVQRERTQSPLPKPPSYGELLTIHMDRASVRAAFGPLAETITAS